MKIKEIIQFLESKVPKSMQESYDNCGVQVGDVSAEATGVIVSLDCTEEIVQEAIDKGVNLIVAHHPVIFKGLKSLTGKNYVERTVLKAIKNDICIYAIHTNLDNYRYGVNHKIGQKLGLENLEILAPKQNDLIKLSVFVPKDHLDNVQEAIFKAGAGNVGDYSECSFSSGGAGTFKPLEGSKPFSGEEGVRSLEAEVKLEAIMTRHIQNEVINAMLKTHPYEEVAYDLISLENENLFSGAGMIGTLPKAIDTLDFLNFVKKSFDCGVVRHTNIHKKEMKTIAFCGGSGSFLLKNALAKKADMYITGDMKYHEFFDAENKIIIADIGHFESEQYTIELLGDDLMKNFPKFAVHFTGVNTNPINYL